MDDRIDPTRQRVLTEKCPKCGLRMFNHAGRMTKCQQCQHEWYMDTSKREDSASQHISEKS